MEDDPLTSTTAQQVGSAQNSSSDGSITGLPGSNWTGTAVPAANAFLPFLFLMVMQGNITPHAALLFLLQQQAASGSTGGFGAGGSTGANEDGLGVAGVPGAATPSQGSNVLGGFWGNQGAPSTPATGVALLTGAPATGAPAAGQVGFGALGDDDGLPGAINAAAQATGASDSSPFIFQGAQTAEVLSGLAADMHSFGEPPAATALFNAWTALLAPQLGSAEAMLAPMAPTASDLLVAAPVG